MTLDRVNDDTSPMGPGEIDRDVKGITEEGVTEWVGGAPIRDIVIGEGMRGRIEFREEVCIKTVVRGVGAMKW